MFKRLRVWLFGEWKWYHYNFNIDLAEWTIIGEAKIMKRGLKFRRVIYSEMKLGSKYLSHMGINVSKRQVDPERLYGNLWPLNEKAPYLKVLGDDCRVTLTEITKAQAMLEAL